VIKIIYRDLSPGLHASAETLGRHTVISLLPGLTPDQRRAALRRIRHSGRMGHGPQVPAAGLALALALDRIKATARTGAAVVRLHPAGSTLPVVLLSAAAVVFVLMATVSIHVLPGPKSSDQSPAIGGVTPGPGSSVPQASQSAAPPVAIPGHPTQRVKAPDRLTARRPSSGGAAGTSGQLGANVPGVTGFGTEPGQTGSGTVTATSAGPEGGSGSGSGGSGSGSGRGAGSAGSGASAGSAGSGSGSGATGSGSGGSGSSSGSTSRSAGTGTAGSGTTGSGSGGSGSGSSGSGGSGTGTGSGSSGTGSTGSGSTGSGSTGSAGSGTTGSSGTGTSSGTGSSGSSGSGGLCLTLLSIQACIG
jgi:hypothetical protein